MEVAVTVYLTAFLIHALSDESWSPLAGLSGLAFPVAPLWDIPLTTILADLRCGLIGADSFCSAGYRSSKLLRTKKGVFGLAGDDRAIARFEAFIRGGKKPEQITDAMGEEFAALQVFKGRLFIWGEAMRPEELITPYHGVGSGGLIACAALRHGATLLEALETAAYYDGASKPPFETWPFD